MRWMLAFIPLAGCVVYETERPTPPPEPAPVNRAPYFEWGGAGCYWDRVEQDSIWFFEAEVGDPDGVLDVVAIHADVYDGISGHWADSFELFPTQYADYWFSDWLGRTTYLSCDYRHYLADLTVIDAFGDFTIVTVEPYTDF